MKKAKTLNIGCAICDTRKIQEETYAEYDKITLGAGVIIVNERSKAVLERLDIDYGAAEIIELDDADGSDIPLVTINGDYSIGSAVPPEDNIILMVNGELTISPGAGEAMSRYKRILVNGGVLCPDSMTAHLSRVAVNGRTTAYPDDCTLLPDNFVIDKYFPLRAADNGKYFVPDTVKLLDTTVDVARLAAKGVSFKAKKLLLPEEKIEEIIPLFGETTEFIVAPRGYAVVDGESDENPIKRHEGVKLDEEFLRKYGNKVFVYGNLNAKDDISEIAPKIDALTVTGRVTLTKKSAADFEKINAEYGKAVIVKGTVYQNMTDINLSKHALKYSEDGISIQNCGTVTIDKDVTPEDILSLVDMKNIEVVVVCSEEQAMAVGKIGTRIEVITTEPIDRAAQFDDMDDGKSVNVGKYVM